MAVTETRVPETAAVLAPDREHDPGKARRGGGSRTRVLAGLLLALQTPVLVTLAHPPVGLWPLIWVAYVPMAVAWHHVLPRRWAPAALFVGLGGMWAVMFSEGLADGEVAIVYQLMPLYVGVIAALVGWRSRGFQARTNYRWFALSIPLAWMAIDYLRSTGHETLGGTWGLRAYVMYDHPALLQPVSVFGIYGLELLILLFNFAVAGVVLARLNRDVQDVQDVQDGRGRSRRARRHLAAVTALVAVWVASSLAILGEPDGAVVRVAAVQTGVERGSERWEERYARDVEQTRRAAAQGAELVIWNEAGLALDPQRDRTDELRALAAETGVHLAIGYRVDEPDGRTRNEVTVLTPAGRFLGTYGKDHPGTFAGDYSDTQGTYPVYETELGPLATIICYDLDYTDTARIMTRRGARLIAAPSADVPAIARTHWTHLVFRAIENRVPMVKADNEFDSVILDQYGRVLDLTVASDGGGRATLVRDVPLGSGASPWVSFGGTVGWAAVAGALAFSAVSVRSRFRARRSGTAASAG